MISFTRAARPSPLHATRLSLALRPHNALPQALAGDAVSRRISVKPLITNAHESISEAKGSSAGTLAIEADSKVFQKRREAVRAVKIRAKAIVQDPQKTHIEKVHAFEKLLGTTLIRTVAPHDYGDAVVKLLPFVMSFPRGTRGRIMHLMLLPVRRQERHIVGGNYDRMQSAFSDLKQHERDIAGSLPPRSR